MTTTRGGGIAWASFTDPFFLPSFFFQVVWISPRKRRREHLATRGLWQRTFGRERGRDVQKQSSLCLWLPLVVPAHTESLTHSTQSRLAVCSERTCISLALSPLSLARSHFVIFLLIKLWFSESSERSLSSSETEQLFDLLLCAIRLLFPPVAVFVCVRVCGVFFIYFILFEEEEEEEEGKCVLCFGCASPRGFDSVVSPRVVCAFCERV